MLIFNPDERELRRNSQRVGVLKISDDVVSKDNVDPSIEDGCLLVNKNESSEFTLYMVLNEIGLFGKQQCDVEVVLCQDKMLIKLVKGQMLIRDPQSGELMQVYIGLSEDEVKSVDLGKVSWISTAKVRDVMRYFQHDSGYDVCSKYPDEFLAEIRMDGDGSCFNSKLISCYDISEGFISEYVRDLNAKDIKRNHDRMLKDVNKDAYFDEEYEVDGDDLDDDEYDFDDEYDEDDFDI